MRILIDGDSFPNIRDIVEIASSYLIDVYIYCDYSHNIKIDSSNVFVIYSSIYNNSADIYLVNDIKKNDIVLTGDYGVATIALTKGVLCLDKNGDFYTNDNIDYLLEVKNFNRKKRLHKNVKGCRKRTVHDRKKLLFKLDNILRGELDEEKK